MPVAAERPRMPLDQAANLVAETLTSAVDSTATTLAVDDASAYPDPANGEYNVVVWDPNSYEAPADDPDAEIVRVTGRDTGADTLTVTRGTEGTTAASHPTGARVPLALTAKMIDDIEAELDAAGAVSVSDDTNAVVSNVSDINFAANLDVFDDGDDTVTVDAASSTDTRTDVSENGTQIVADTEDIDFSATDAATVSVTDDGDGSASVEISVTDTDTDTRTDVSEATTTVVADVEDINFEATGDAGVTVADDGDGSVTVTVDAADTDTTANISEDGTQVVAETTDINFADNVSVVDDGDGSVTINVTDTNTDTRTDVSDGGTTVVSEVSDINFAANLTVTDDGDGTVSVDGGSGASVTSLEPTQAVSGEEPSASGTNALALAVADSDFGDASQATAADALALGNGAQAEAPTTTAVGHGADALQEHDTGLGDSAIANGFAAVAAGWTAFAGGDSAVAIGRSSSADATESIALGYNADTGGVTRLTANIGNSETLRQETDGRLQAGPDSNNLADVSTQTVTRRYAMNGGN